MTVPGRQVFTIFFFFNVCEIQHIFILFYFEGNTTSQETVLLVLLFSRIGSKTSIEDFFLHSFLPIYPISPCLLPQQPWFVHCKDFIKIKESRRKDEYSSKFIMAILLSHSFHAQLIERIYLCHGLVIGSGFIFLVFRSELFHLGMLHKFSVFQFHRS